MPVVVEPEISVVVPAYNAARYLQQTIESVLCQTFAKWELVIVDNASTDETQRVIDDLLVKANDSRIRAVRNNATVAAPENWNIAVSMSRAGLLKLLCADDVLEPDALERQYRSLKDHPQASFATSARLLINSSGKPLFVRNAIGKSGFYDGNAMIRRCIMSGTNIIGEPVHVMWRRSAMERVGLFDPEVAYATDVEYWLRLLGVGGLFHDVKPVGWYRIHADAATTRLAAVTVEDFARTARKQVDRGTVTLSAFDLRVVRANSWLKSKVRQVLYKTLG